MSETTLFGRLNEALLYGKLPNHAAKLLLSDAQTALLNRQAEIERLRAALKALMDAHEQLVSCGDCGNWDVWTEPEMIVARDVLETTQ